VYSVRKLADSQGYLWDNSGLVVERRGSSLGSEDLVYSLIASATRSRDSLFDHPSLAVLREHRIRNILLIDDSIGSGKRVSDFIRATMAPRTFCSWWSFGFIRFHILSLARTRESEKAILHATPGSNHGKRVHPKSLKVNFASDIVYSKESLRERWGDGYQAISDLCDSTTAIRREYRRGFGKVMANIVFDHSVPNNIPGVIWYRGDRWSPLFPGRALPDWVLEALDGSSAPGGAAEDGRVTQASPMMIRLLHLIKRGVRRESTIALRMDADNDLIRSLIGAAQASGFITSHNRITEPGVSLVRRAGGSGADIEVDRSLYVPRSWCTGRATVQPSASQQTDPASAGGEAG
jgi:hypothetical protein